MRRAVLLLVALALAGGGAFLLSRGLAPPAPRLSLVVVTIDTMRLDAVGEGTPALLDFLGEAMWFRGARSAAPITFPSHTTIFTGLLPARHRVHDNVAEPVPPPAERDFPLLAEEFREAGYETAAFVAQAVLSPETGIASGFEIYECPKTARDSLEYRPAKEQVDKAIAWLRGRGGDRPFLLWVHLFDPHAPYFPFEGDARRKGTRPEDLPDARYAGEVRRADAAIERLLAALDPAVAVVIASDHGEDLAEHDEPTHGVLCYGTTVDALLAVRAPGYARGAADTGPRSLADVAPAIRALCGLAPRPTDGRPLLGPPHDVVVTESFRAWRVHGWAQCLAASDGQHTLVESGPRVELFDRESDPKELRPLDPAGHPALERLERALDRLRETALGDAPETRLTPAVAPYGEARRPFAFYLPRRDNAQLPDPRPLLWLWERIESMPRAVLRAAAAKDVAALRAAVQDLDGLAQAAQVSPVAHQYKAYALFELGRLAAEPERYREAARELCRAIELGQVLPESFLDATRYAVLGGGPDELREVLRLAETKRLWADPAVVAAMRDGGRALGMQDDPVLARLLQRWTDS